MRLYASHMELVKSVYYFHQFLPSKFSPHQRYILIVLPLEHVAVGAATLPRAGGNAGEQATTLEPGLRRFGQSICPEISSTNNVNILSCKIKQSIC